MKLFSRLFGRPERQSPSSERRTAEALLTRAAPAYAVIDVETTGLSPRADRILELAVVRVDAGGGVLDEWVTRFNPEGPVGATHIHGISDADVASAPLFREVAGDVARRINRLPVVAHNARFDLAFLRSEFRSAGWTLPWLPSFCTLHSSYHYLPNLDRRRLADCCWESGVPLNDAHSALGDAHATAGLLAYYLGAGARHGRHPDLHSLADDARGVTWPTGPERAPSTNARRAAPINSRNIRVTPPRPTAPPLLQQLTSLSLVEVLDEGAPQGALTYLELLLSALEDGEISEAERAELADLALVYELDAEAIAVAHRALVLALAHRAVDDGHVSNDERAQLYAVTEALDVPKTFVTEVIKHADAARSARLGAKLKTLPDDWAHGSPLRVGEKVVFTGCDDRQRDRLERRAEKLGVRVMSSVSRQTAMLVSDDSLIGAKYEKALELGIRVVHPDLFEVLLAHLQPAASAPTLSPVRFGSHAPGPSPSTEQATVDDGVLVPTASAADIVTVVTAPPSRSPAEIRQWAIQNGYAVGVRGRLPREVVEAFEAAAAS